MQDMLAADIADSIAHKKPMTRKAFIRVIQEFFSGTDLLIIDTHNTASAIFIILDERPILLKAEYGRDTATHREVGWYEHQRATGKDHHKLFIAGRRAEEHALLFLRYIDGTTTLDEWALKTSADGSDFGKLIIRALTYDRSLFAETSKKASRSEIEQFVLSKYRSRREEAKQTPYLDDLLAVSHVTINGKRYLTPDFAMDRITRDPATMKRLLPTQIGFIHGDLHTGNVLTKDGELYYIDPNGNLSMPIEYDIGKLLHSVHGQYPLIMRGSFLVEERRKGDFTYAVHTSKVYDEAHEYLRNHLTYDEYLRALYAEALHFATMLPHHTKNRAETIALYLRATELFDELLAMLK